MNRLVIAAVVIASGLTGAALAQDIGPLATARDLYASARYDEALAVLNGLRAGDRAERKWVEQYRSLCLLALGRADEAESAIAAVVTADPTYRPGEADAAPRVRATFTDVRRRLLPEIATNRYKAAKGSYDRGEWAEAQREFQIVLSLIDDPDMEGRLGDLRVLAAGFLELSARAAEPPPSPAHVAAPRREPPVQQAAIFPDPDKIYMPDDDGVVPPPVVRQDIPKVPTNIIRMARPSGLLEVVVDEQGRVISMTMRRSIHPTYDALLLTAARNWKYQPARIQGTPVKFRKLIQISVTR